ncbi:hypothetical protein FXB39_03045 [Nocardioides sp. BGMRC 2183]|nr:hypothetical protein FXB39_03045 [Nocardioides sp. BGMRC 2183]
MSTTLIAHLAYLAVSLPIVIWVGQTLGRHGQAFLSDVFDRPEVAVATNRLLVVGYYLLNLGFVLLYLRAGGPVADATELVESLSVKVGVVLLVTGLIHVVNVKIFSALHRRHLIDQQSSAHYRAQLDAWSQRQPAAPR